MAKYEASEVIQAAYCPGIDINTCLVYLNGNRVDYCIFADEESGEVHWIDDRRTRKVKGDVRIEWAAP